MKLGTEVGPGHIVLDGDPTPPPPEGTTPNFRPMFIVARRLHGSKMVLGTEVGFSPGDFVLDGDQAPLPPLKKEAEPWPSQFSAHFYCGQTAGCTKMPLLMVVGLIRGDFLSDWNPAPSTKRGLRRQIIFWPMFIVYCCQTTGWMKMALGMEVGLSPGYFVLDGDPAPTPKRVRSPFRNFRSISIVAKRLDASRCHLVWM